MMCMPLLDGDPCSFTREPCTGHLNRHRNTVTAELHIIARAHTLKKLTLMFGAIKIVSSHTHTHTHPHTSGRVIHCTALIILYGFI